MVSRKKGARGSISVGTSLDMTRRDALRAGARAGIAAVASSFTRSAYANLEPYIEPEVRHSESGLLHTTLRVNLAKHMIAGHALPHHRSYEGGLLGPTLRLRAGDRLKVDFFNLLPKEHDVNHTDINTPHGFNTTNLHTHGLQVSPSGNADNVFLRIRPGESFQYDIDIPEDHPPGTHWYHAHKHGSTAAQVGEGLAGALIVEGELDEIAPLKVAKERLLVIQNHRIPHDKPIVVPKTINGVVQPRIRLRPGAVERWRIINAGNRQILTLKLESHRFYVIALDGLALGRVVAVNSITLAPGNRADVLVKGGAANQLGYKLLNIASGKWPVQGTNVEMLARVVSSGPELNMRLPRDSELRSHVPFSDISDDEIVNPGKPRRVTFTFDKASGLVGINGMQYDPERIDHTLILGQAEEWLLSDDTPFGPHRFHMHVNPFQVVQVGDQKIKSPMWRDVILVGKGKPVKIRARYKTFTGRTVLHCHILLHEDKGMMQVIKLLA